MKNKFNYLLKPQILFSLYFFLLVALTLFVFQRPYFISLADGDANYYYNMLLIALGKHPNIVVHPGTFQYFLGGFFLRILGANEINFIEKAQFFIMASYLLQSVFFFAALVFYFKRLTKWFEAWALCIPLLIVVASPTFLGWSLDYYGPEGYMPSINLFLITFFLDLVHGKKARFIDFIVFNLLCGVAVNVKMNQIAIVAPVWLFYNTAFYLYDSNFSFKFFKLLKTSLFAVLLTPFTFALLMWPVRDKLIEIYGVVVVDRPVVPGLQKSAFEFFLQNTFSYLILAPLSLVFIGLIVFLIVKNFKMQKPKRLKNLFLYFAENMSVTLSVAFLTSMIFLMSMNFGAHENKIYTFSIYSRNVFPFFTIAPYLFVSHFNVVGKNAKKILHGAVLFSILSALIFTVYRAQAIKTITAKQSAIENSINEISKEKKRIGLWWNHGSFFFPAEWVFHYRGSAMYAGSYFDNLINRYYPKYSWAQIEMTDLAWSQIPMSQNVFYKNRVGGVLPRVFSPHTLKNSDEPYQFMSGDSSLSSVEMILVLGDSYYIRGMRYNVFKNLLKRDYKMGFSKRIKVPGFDEDFIDVYETNVNDHNETYFNKEEFSKIKTYFIASNSNEIPPIFTGVRNDLLKGSRFSSQDLINFLEKPYLYKDYLFSIDRFEENSFIEKNFDKIDYSKFETIYRDEKFILLKAKD